MAESLGTSVLELDGDLSKLERTLAQGQAKAAASGRATGKSFKEAIAQPLARAALPAAVVFGAAVLGVKKVINAASSLNEAQSAVNVTFGKSAGIINAYSKSTEDAFSQVAFLAAAKSFGGFGKAAGLAGEDLAHFSSRLVFAAQDMASFHDADPTQVLEDIRSALAGETEPLRKYNILLNDAALRQEAMRQGLVKNTKEALSPQNKTLAAQALILAQLGPAQGDYKRTADGVANTERRQAANTEDLNAKLGKGLTPAYQVLQRILLTVTSFMGEHTKAVQIAVFVIAGLAAGILIANAAIKTYAAGQAIVTAATWLWNAALAANPIVLVVAALVLLGIALVVGYRKFEGFRKVVQAVFGWVKSHWPLIAAILAGPIALAVLLIVKHFGAIKSFLLGFVDTAKRIAGKIGSSIKNGIVGGLKGLAGAAGGVIKAAINAIIGLWNRLAIPSFSKKIGVGPASVTLSTPRIDFPNIPYLHEGGIVPGRPGADVPIIAKAGEGVLTAEQMRARGPLVHIERQEINRDVDIDLAVAELGRKLAVRL